MTYDDLLDRVQVEHLTIFGTLLGARGTILLLGPHEPGFWPAICDSPEWRDGAADPVDRWSRRVITGLADRLGAQTHFPFGTHPAPFLTWALASNRAWTSPVGMLVQAEAGLMVSYRGALEFDCEHPNTRSANTALHRMRRALHHRLPSWRAARRPI